MNTIKTSGRSLPSARIFSLAVFVCMIPAAAQPQDSPDKLVQWFADSLANNRPQVLWQALPTSYQNDVTGLIHDYGEKMDRELWNQTFRTLNKLVRVLDEKRAFILQQPMVSQRLEAAPNAEASYDAVIRVLRTLLESEVSDLDRLKTLDPESFLSGTVARILEEIGNLTALSPESVEELEGWKSVKATLLASNGDTATVRIESPGEPAEDISFLRVEGKWIPRDLAEKWTDSVTEARQQLAKMSDSEFQQNRQQIFMFEAMADGILDQLLAAENQEQFNQTLQSILGVAMSQMGTGDDGS